MKSNYNLIKELVKQNKIRSIKSDPESEEKYENG